MHGNMLGIVLILAAVVVSSLAVSGAYKRILPAFHAAQSEPSAGDHSSGGSGDPNTSGDRPGTATTIGR